LNFLSTASQDPAKQTNPYFNNFFDSPGYLLINTSETVTAADFSIDVSAADDFRYGIFRTPLKSTFQPYNSSTRVAGVVNFGGYFTDIGKFH